LKFNLRKKPSIERSVEETLKKVKVESYLEGKIERIASPLPSNIEIIDDYQAGYNKMAKVVLYQDLDSEVYVYHIEEPPVSPTVESLYQLVRERFQSMEMELPEKLTDRVLVYEKYLAEALKELGYEDAYTKYPELRYYIIRDIAGWRILDVPMRDPNVEELDYSSTKGNLSVVVKHDKIMATWVDTNVSISEDELAKLIEFLAFKTNKQISVAQPLLEARTPEGYRLAANLKEVGMSPAFTIRKFPERSLSLTQLVYYNTMSSLMAAYLWTLVENQRFILVIGPMASGKTTILQAITSVIPRDKKVVCVAPGTRVATNVPHVIDTLFVGTPEVKGNIESVDGSTRVLGFVNGKVLWTNARKIHRIHIPKDIKLIRIITEFGTEVTVTPNTKIPVVIENNIVYKPASEIKVGDIVFQLARYEPLEVKEPDVATMLDSHGFRIYLSKPVRDKKARLVRTLRIRDYLDMKDRTLEPLGLYIRGSRDVLPVPVDKLPDPEVSYLAGYLLGVWRELPEVKRLRFRIQREEILEKIIRIVKKLGIRYSIAKSGKIMSAPHILWQYLHTVYGIPVDDKNVLKVPSWLFVAPEEHVKAFLSGLIDAISIITDNELVLSHTSKELVEDIAVLALRFGALGKISKENTPSGTVHTIRFVNEYALKLSDATREYSVKIKGFKWYKNQEQGSYTISNQHLNATNYVLARVVKVEEVDHNGIVYDITPEDAQYFFAGNGGFIAVEDTIEDTPELRLAHPRWQALYTRRSVYGTEQDITIFDLARYSLRTRAQYIIIGEVRDREIQTLVQMAASVSRDTPVLIRINGEVREVRIGDIVDRMYEEAGNPPDWSRVAPSEKIEVLTLTRDGRVEFKPIAWALRHYHRGKLYRIWYRVRSDPSVAGYVDVTWNHSVFVKRGGNILAIRGDEVKVGDTLIITHERLWWRAGEAEVFKVEEVDYDGYVYDFSVPNTEAFFGGTVPVLLHNSGHGSLCLHGNETVRVRVNGHVTDVPIRDLVEKMLRGELRDVEALSIDLKSGRLEWKRIRRVYKVPTNIWVIITTSSGIRIVATPDHQFPLSSGRISRADEVKVGDELLRLSVSGVEPDRIAGVEKVSLKEPEWSYDVEVEDNHTFLVNGKIFSMNCTFHAEDPETLFLRLTSPPLSVQPSFLLTISSIVLQRLLWSRKYRTFVRRTAKIWEITGLKPVIREGEIPVTYKEIFVWDPGEDYHYPDDVETLVDESKQIQLIAKSTYGEDEWYERIIWELTEKKNFIEQLVRDKVFDFKEVTERIYRKTLELKRKG